MTAIVFLIQQIAVGLLIFIGITILWYLRKFLVERSEYRATYFELERDLSRYRQLNAITVIIVLVELAVIVVGIQQVVAPTLSEEARLGAIAAQVPQDIPFETPLPPTLSGSRPDFPDVPPIGGDDVVAGPQPTATLTPTPVGTIIPNPPPISGCDNPDVQLQKPANGMRVFHTIDVTGLANIENFTSAKIEISGPSTFGEFIVVDDKRLPIEELSSFSQFNPAPYEPGWYQFRLAVFDLTDTMRAHCMVNIWITEPFPTPTPIGQEGT